MKTDQLDRLLGTADEWQRPWAAVDPEPVDAGDGGGGSEEGEGDDTPLGPVGEKTLRDERALRKSLTKDLEELRAQMAQMKGLVDPTVYAQAQAQAAALRQQLDEKERLSADERRRLEAKADKRVSDSDARAAKAEAKELALQVKTAAQSLFMATGGRDGGDGKQTFFEAWFAFHGKRHIRVDPVTEKAYIVDSEGDPEKQGDQNVDPVAWLNEQADTSAVVGSFFKPKGGSGGGGLVGARGFRTSQGYSPEQVKAMSPSEKLAAHREAAARR